MNDTATNHTVPRVARGYYFFTLIASLIGAALQMVLLLSEYDVSIGMYRNDSLLASVFTGFVLIVAVAILTMPFVARKEKLPPLTELPSSDTPVMFASTLSGFILIAVLILQLVLKTPISGTLGTGDYFWIAVLILAVPTAIFFFLPAFPLKNKARIEKAFAFFPVIWCAVYLMHTYFDKSTALRSPVRILSELAMIASMLFFLMELRVRVGKSNPTGLATFVNVSIFFSSICAIPLISVAFINQWILETDILYSAVQLCFLTYFIARANTLIKR